MSGHASCDDRIFFQVLQSDRGASRDGRELWQQHGAACFQALPVSQLEEQETQASDTSYRTHVKSIRAERKMGWAERESRGKSLLPASVLQYCPCCYSQRCYLYLLQRTVILTSRLQVRARLTVHFSLAKSAKQSRSLTAALGCFHPLLKCSQAPWQTFCTRHHFEKEMRVAFPLDTTGGISDRQNVITWPGVRPGAGPKTPTLM